MKQEELYHLLENMKLAVGYGHNRFTMSRGSFRYRRINRWRHRTKLHRYTRNENGFTLGFIDEQNKREYLLDVVQEGNTFQVSLRDEYPDVNRYWIILPSDAQEHFYGFILVQSIQFPGILKVSDEYTFFPEFYPEYL